MHRRVTSAIRHPAPSWTSTSRWRWPRSGRTRSAPASGHPRWTGARKTNCSATCEGPGGGGEEGEGPPTPTRLRTSLSCIPLLPAAGSWRGCRAAPHHPDLRDGARWPVSIPAAGSWAVVLGWRELGGAGGVPSPVSPSPGCSSSPALKPCTPP